MNNVICETIKKVSAEYNVPEELLEEYSGKFVLGSGGINKTEYIVTYRLTEDGGKVYYKLPRQKVIIYDTLEEGEQPYVEIITTGYTSETKLYIPQNTVEKEIDVDL